MTTEVPWKRISLESIAIVGSILLAFAIDAWWDNRQNQTAEQQFLQTLVIDLEETKRGLIGFERRLKGRQEAIGNALKKLGGTEPGSASELENFLWPIEIAEHNGLQFYKNTNSLASLDWRIHHYSAGSCYWFSGRSLV